MQSRRRIRDYGIKIGELKTGVRNAITDVQGVKVGHVTLLDEAKKTGVTAVLPHEGNIFKEKVFAASHVINGFGKSTGLVQIEELGTLETPIILTNTLSVGMAFDSLVDYMLETNEDIGDTTGTVNPVICECNDGRINDIRGKHIKKEHIFKAILSADVDFEEGAVGAGTGMCCYGLKGGIGTSSRDIELDNGNFTVGVLALTNFGEKKDLLVDGEPIGREIICMDQALINEEDRGSVIIIIATDLPMTHRQLKRMCKRAVVGLSRTGSYISNGSGDVVLGFTTKNRMNHYTNDPLMPLDMLHENYMDYVFRGVKEATEESVLNALVTSDAMVDRKGIQRESLSQYMK
ncbi:DmpA family aminopeptidase [Vallitalea okinawensis]|uniref:DmpA family aminopeptidase n=1 Tax=Vallitalea okinawensis TaxID=2078660 RepID=UPI000CFC1F40|nr:P1 family peptidase [Vallitalea okinawensis]